MKSSILDGISRDFLRYLIYSKILVLFVLLGMVWTYPIFFPSTLILGFSILPTIFIIHTCISSFFAMFEIGNKRKTMNPRSWWFKGYKSSFKYRNHQIFERKLSENFKSYNFKFPTYDTVIFRREEDLTLYLLQYK